MIRKFAVAALAVVALGFVVAAPAQAGGGSGGGKKTATIKVRNQTLNPVYAIARTTAQGVPTAGEVAGWVATPSSFYSAGGVTIGSGGFNAFKVAPGTGTINALDTLFLNPGSGAYIGTGSQTGYMNITQPGGLGNPLVVAGSATAF